MKRRTISFIGALATDDYSRLNHSSARLTPIWLLVLCIQIVASGSAAGQATQAAVNQVPPLMDRQTEIALALSACPSSIAGKAAVYVLDKPGYIKVREGENSFTAIVQHVMPTSQEPQCIDSEGARTILPRILKVAELRAQGKAPEEIKRFVAEAYATGAFSAPARPGVIYMLSRENLLDKDKPPFPPHVMFYGTHLTNADLGTDGSQTGPAFVAGEGTPLAFIIVPVGTHPAESHAPADKPSGSPQ